MTAILGISAFYHDSAAALVIDGEIVAAAQEGQLAVLDLGTRSQRPLKCSLDHPVPDGGDRKLADLSTSLGDSHLPDPLRTVPSVPIMVRHFFPAKLE